MRFYFNFLVSIGEKLEVIAGCGLLEDGEQKSVRNRGLEVKQLFPSFLRRTNQGIRMVS
jgi:hypothetical protein